MEEPSLNVEQKDTKEDTVLIQTAENRAVTNASPKADGPAVETVSPCHRSALKGKNLLVVVYVMSIFAVAALSFYFGRLHTQRALDMDASPHMIVETLWATPLARTHLRTHPDTWNLTEFNNGIAEAVAKDYSAFRANHSEYSASDVNDLFFVHQVGEEWEKKKEIRARVEGLAHRKLLEFELVADCAANLADRLLAKFGEEALGASRKMLQGWATFHDSSSRHVLHVHAGSTLSIVYYVKMGQGAQLRLYDPRGPRPPFEGSIEVWPEEGELIAFPGWLAHEVEAGSGERISLVFNVPGKWEGDEFGGESMSLGRWEKAKGWRLEFSEERK